MSLTAAEQQRKQEALEPADSKRLLGRTSESRYTDPKRTSSSSFKPPMSKEAAMKNNSQTPQADSSIYSAFSYLKRVFVGKPTTETATPNVKSSQVRKRNVSPSPTKEVKNEAGGAVELEENANIASGNLSQPPLAVTAVNKQTGINKQSSFKNGDKSKRVESLSNVNNRDQPCAEKIENDENKDIPKSDIPNYTPVRFVDNRSTYLHTPEKKGTTSFRITTARKHVPNTPMPTLLSPTIVQSQTQPAANKRLSSSKIKETKILKKKAGSPVRKDTAVSRMRSKSTPDSSSLKTRSQFHRIKASLQRSKSKADAVAERETDVKVRKERSATDALSDYMKNLTGYSPRIKNDEIVPAETRPRSTASLPRHHIRSLSPGRPHNTASETHFRSGHENPSRSAKLYAPVKASAKEPDQNESTFPEATKKVIESAVGAALEVIASLSPERRMVEKKPENTPQQKETNALFSPRYHRSKASPTKSEPQEVKGDEEKAPDSLSSTLAMISSIVQKKLSPLLDTPDETSDTESRAQTEDESETQSQPSQFRYLKKKSGKQRSTSSFLKSTSGGIARETDL